jgi:hypothetical protein
MAWGRGRSAWVLAASAAVALALGLFLLLPRDEILVAFDEAFAATRPDLTKLITDPHPFGRRFVYLELPLETGPSKLVQALAARKRPPLAIAVSPLLGRGLIEGATRNAMPAPGPLIIVDGGPDFPAPPPGSPPLSQILTDPLPAYHEVGELLGGIISDYRAGTPWSGSPAPAAEAALLFSPGPSRTPEAVAAFSAGWSSKTIVQPKIEELAEGGSEAEASNRVRILLEGDLKALFVAASPKALGALSLALDPARITGLAGSAPSAAALAFPLASFTIHPDEAGIVRRLSAFRPGTVPSEFVVPWILDPLPGAKSLSARGIELDKRVKQVENKP